MYTQNFYFPCEYFDLQSYEEAFQSIQEATGITDIDQLVSRFIEGMYVLE